MATPYALDGHERRIAERANDRDVDRTMRDDPFKITAADRYSVPSATTVKVYIEAALRVCADLGFRPIPYKAITMAGVVRNAMRLRPDLNARQLAALMTVEGDPTGEYMQSQLLNDCCTFVGVAGDDRAK